MQRNGFDPLGVQAGGAHQVTDSPRSARPREIVAMRRRWPIPEPSSQQYSHFPIDAVYGMVRALFGRRRCIG